MKVAVEKRGEEEESVSGKRCGTRLCEEKKELYFLFTVDITMDTTRTKTINQYTWEKESRTMGKNEVVYT